jgi:hypothetical protein
LHPFAVKHHRGVVVDPGQRLLQDPIQPQAGAAVVSARRAFVVVFPDSLATVRSARRAVCFPALRPPLRSRLRSRGSGTVRRSRADVASLRSATSRFAVTTLRPLLRSDHSPPDFA